MLRSAALLECPEEEPVILAGLPAGPRRRRRGVGVETRKAGLRIVAVAGASFDTSTGLTSASGVSVVSFSRPALRTERVSCCRSAGRT